MAAAANLELLIAVVLRGWSLNCPQLLVQLGRSVCNCGSLGSREEGKHRWPFDDRFVRVIGSAQLWNRARNGYAFKSKSK